MPEDLQMPESQMRGHDLGSPLNQEALIDRVSKTSEKRGIQSTLKDYEVRIRFLAIGMVISVGCKDVAFTSVEEGMAALNAYVADPHTEIKKWIEKFD